MSPNPSRSFDRAANIYDQTRPLHEPAASQGIDAILQIAGPEARFLDVGTGTGRISVPLLERGADLVGFDLSAKMLGQLLEKHPTARIAMADATHIPFPAGHFDALLTVHVMHLVGEWRQALAEFKRVLKPGGVYLNVQTYETVGPSARRQMRDFWWDWLADHGTLVSFPGVSEHGSLVEELANLGATVNEQDVVHYGLRFTPREELERFEGRVYSNTWDIPDDIYQASLRALANWAAEQYGSLDREFEDEVRFSLDIVRF
jgi:ubiquinone/menaquinone biosynthesis C-methylase UbiE